MVEWLNGPPSLWLRWLRVEWVEKEKYRAWGRERGAGTQTVKLRRNSDNSVVIKLKGLNGLKELNELRLHDCKAARQQD